MNSSMADFKAAWALCKQFTMVPERYAMLAFDAVRHIDEHDVPGAIVELGVWRGGMSCIMAQAQQKRHHRTMWLYDTFEGLPPPTEDDDAKSKELYAKVARGQRAGIPGGVQAKGKWCYGSIEEVRNTMEAVAQYPSRHLHYVRGKVEDTLVNASLERPTRIALLRLDTDWHASTRAELRELWPLLSPGGWLYVDDYSQWGGAQKATQEWLHEHGWGRKANYAGLRFPSNGPLHVYKADPYNETRPFEPNTLPAWQER